jgi:hypothetical protein
MAELPKDLIHSIPPGIFVGWLVQTFGWLMLHTCDLAAGAHSRGEARDPKGWQRVAKLV